MNACSPMSANLSSWQDPKWRSQEGNALMNLRALSLTLTLYEPVAKALRDWNIFQCHQTQPYMNCRYQHIYFPHRSRRSLAMPVSSETDDLEDIILPLSSLLFSLELEDTELFLVSSWYHRIWLTVIAGPKLLGISYPAPNVETDVSAATGLTVAKNTWDLNFE